MVVKWCQSKHVRLITKCYPPRTANPPKPNSSELSYLTYYAYTTPSKLKKVGRYLEHRAQIGLTKGRTGDVSVTLDICTALIKKCYRDLGLFASNVVAILHAVVKDGELVLVEHSVLTLKAFCAHHDGKLLTISQPYRAEYQQLCRRYAQYGLNQDDMRTQYVSLDAVSAIISSESFQSSSAGGQVRIIIPVLINILSQSNSSLSILQNKYVSYVLTDISLSEPPLSPRERRQSFFTREGTTAQSVVQSGSPRSSMQLDYTEQENSLIALKNLRQFCEMNNASLIRIGLDCIMDELATLDSCNAAEDYPSWTVELVTLLTTWLPIQHRYLTVLACLEDLGPSKSNSDRSISTPKKELILTILEGILTTGESLIGLNVIDVLNTLIEQIAIQLTVRPNTTTDVVQKLVNCIVGLAGHIYYSDQILDICSAIMDWSLPLFQALQNRSGKITPALEGLEQADDVLDVKVAGIWSLRILRGVLSKGGGMVGLEDVWTGTEGALAGSDGEVRMAYVDALVTHIQNEDSDEDEPDAQSNARFLTMILVPIYKVLKRGDTSPSDYWAIWVLLLALLKRFGPMHVVKVLPMMWRVLDVSAGTVSREQVACLEGLFMGFLFAVAEKFKIPNLRSIVSQEIEIQKTLDEWPVFIDPHTNPAKVSLNDISSTLLIFPTPTESPRPFPPDLKRSSLVNFLAFSSAFPHALREHLLVQWSEDATMSDQMNFNSDSQSGQHGHPLSDSQPGSTSAQSRSLEENHPNYIHARKKSLSRLLMERSPSPATQINQLRKVLAGTAIRQKDAGVPNIEVNGERVVSDSTPEEDAALDEKVEGDVTLILDSLNVNGAWNEKVSDYGVKGSEGGIKPPY